jgi:hypothetical protein
MKKKVVLVIPAVLILFSVLGAGATAANFGARPADKGSASLSSSVSGGAWYGGNGAVFVYQAGAIPTALTIDAPGPTATVYAGETLTVGLRLVRTDTHNGIPNAVIRGHYSQDGINWSDPGTVTTDGNGQFTYTGTVPDQPGTYQGYLSYDGDATYQGCASPVYTITVASQAGTPSLGPTPTDSAPVSSPMPAGSSPVGSPMPAGSSLATTKKPTPVSTNSAANVPTSLISISDPSSSGIIQSNEMQGWIARAAIAVIGLAVVGGWRFRKKLT